MYKHEPAGKDEVFIGNVSENIATRLAELEKAGVRVRVGTLAYSIDGETLPPTFKPLFIHREDVPIYDGYMMKKLRAIRGW